MGGEWRRLTLGRIATSDGYGLVDGPFGSNLPASLYMPEGVPVIRGSNLSLGTSRFRANEFVFVSKETAARLERSLCKPDDIVFTKKGTLGQTGLVPWDSEFDQYLLSSNQMKLTVDRSIADPLFVYYHVSSPESVSKIIRDAESTGVPKTNVAYLREFPIALPPLPEQRAIAHILGTLDDKIELNRQRNQTLEAMARALFKDWFVDFGPVRAKMEGREPYLPADLWSLFPDRLDGEGKPEGWGMRPLSQLLTIIGGGTPKTSVDEYWGGDIPWFSVVDTPPASDVFVIATEKTITEAGLNGSSARLIPKGTTIISARGTVGNLAIAGRGMTFNQSCYGLRGIEGAGDYFTYLTAQHMVDRLKSMAHGSVFSTVTRQTFEAIQRPVPLAGIFKAFEGVVAPWFDTILMNVKEARSLSNLRDALLPKLISGELHIKEAEYPLGGLCHE